MNQGMIVTEFGGLIRQELDIESLLRTTLEFVLGRCGPTNAAVFLPTTSGDYSLGAYVNYDCPKETVDVLLDHLANTIAPRLAEGTNLIHLKDQISLARVMGEDAGWLGDSSVVGFPCRQEGECLAVFLLFRDRLSEYTPSLIEQLRTIGELFAAQLARVIRIHHRHIPKDQWGAIGDADDEADDIGGMAA
jgi:hypothetical protein